MINAKDELKSVLPKQTLAENDEYTIKCAKIEKRDSKYWGDVYTENVYEHILPTGYSPQQWDEFWNGIDFEYNAGYGQQELFGNVWFYGPSWLERSEYDGSEWWVLRELPTIPNELL
jgi:hypothetical protein